ncbi:BED-type domain-containing protein [Aphis craccivora]|uniref:BED-type domain-containing protein n=1 Tax=Aphis craccivora TaxID=307492 RepID=A0A6G0W277_APHCR|nr:BED-type domain-containing protein [Aphis craccivora]
MIQYNHPKFPVSNVIYKQRNPPSTLLMLSPPRHLHGGPRNLVVRRQDCDVCANESDQMQSANDSKCQTDICTYTNQSDNENDCDVDTCSRAVSDEVVNQCHSNNKKRREPEDTHDSNCLTHTRRKVMCNAGAMCKEDVIFGVAEDNPTKCTNEPEVLECQQHEWHPVTGDAVLATDRGLYYAGVVDRIEGDSIYNIIPYQSQFINGKFKPIKSVAKLQRAYKRKIILDYENKLNNYLQQYI